jgi:hypothetical protein
MASQRANNGLLVSPHRGGSAGHIFDTRFAELHGLTVTTAPNLKLRQLLVNIQFWKNLHKGYSVAVYAARLSLLPEERLGRSVGVRTTSNQCRKFSQVLAHNIEADYFYDECKASKNPLMKFLNAIQFLFLYFFETLKLQNTKVYCISTHDFQFLAARGINAEFVQLSTVSPLKISRFRAFGEELTMFRPTDLEVANCDAFTLFFYGSYRNRRNIEQVNRLTKMFPKISLYGRHPEMLPKSIRERYKGEIDINSADKSTFVLVSLFGSNAGVQTKVMEWVEAGGAVITETHQIEKLGYLYHEC